MVVFLKFEFGFDYLAKQTGLSIYFLQKITSQSAPPVLSLRGQDSRTIPLVLSVATCGNSYPFFVFCADYLFVTSTPPSL